MHAAPLATNQHNQQRLLPPTCVAVFHLPHAFTATAALAAGPSVAAHSRSADIEISRPMMTAGVDRQAGRQEGRGMNSQREGRQGARQGEKGCMSSVSKLEKLQHVVIV